MPEYRIQYPHNQRQDQNRNCGPNYIQIGIGDNRGTEAKVSIKWYKASIKERRFEHFQAKFLPRTELIG